MLQANINYSLLFPFFTTLFTLSVFVFRCFFQLPLYLFPSRSAFLFLSNFLFEAKFLSAILFHLSCHVFFFPAGALIILFYPHPHHFYSFHMIIFFIKQSIPFFQVHFLTVYYFTNFIFHFSIFRTFFSYFGQVLFSHYRLLLFCFLIFFSFFLIRNKTTVSLILFQTN